MQRLLPASVASFFGSPNTSPNNSPKKSATEQKINIRPGARIKIIPPENEKKDTEDFKEDSSTKKPLNIFTIGCADGGVKATARVAELMERLAADEHFDLIFILGDNFDGKVKSRNSPTFLTHLHHIFSKHPKIRVIPKVAILGNHDVIDENGNLSQEMLSAQNLHTLTKLIPNAVTGDLEYIIDPESGEAAWDLDKIRLLTPRSDESNEIVIRYEDMLKSENQWYMFGSFFSINWGEDIEIVCANTSTLASEYVAYYIDDIKNPFNQAAWLFNLLNTISVETSLFVGHHPVVMTNDKRVIHSDHPDYINPSEYKKLVDKKIAKVNDKGYAVSNHTDILGNIIFHAGCEALKLPKGPGDRFKLFLAAHHHAIHLFKKDNQIQIVSGGMGGENREWPNMQNRFSFADHESLLSFLKNNGVVTLSIPMGKNAQIMVDIYGIADPIIQAHHVRNLHLKFSLDSSKAVVPSYDDKLEKLRILIIATCNQYQKYLSENPPAKPWQIPEWGIVPEKYRGKVYDDVGYDIIFVDALKNYCHSAESISHDQLINYFRFVLSQLTNFPRWQHCFNDMLVKNYNTSYEVFIYNPSENLDNPAALPASPSEVKLDTMPPVAVAAAAINETVADTLGAIIPIPISKPKSLLTELLQKKSEDKKSLPRRNSEEALNIIHRRHSDTNKPLQRRNSSDLLESPINQHMLRATKPMPIGAPRFRPQFFPGGNRSPIFHSNAQIILERKKEKSVEVAFDSSLDSLLAHTAPIDTTPMRREHARSLSGVISFSCPTLPVPQLTFEPTTRDLSQRHNKPSAGPGAGI